MTEAVLDEWADMHLLESLLPSASCDGHQSTELCPAPGRNFFVAPFNDMMDLSLSMKIVRWPLCSVYETTCY